MKQLRNKIGDLAMVVDSSPAYDGMIVECLKYKFGGWIVKNKQGYSLCFQDSQLVPLGGERILVNEPQPNLPKVLKLNLKRNNYYEFY